MKLFQVIEMYEGQIIAINNFPSFDEQFNSDAESLAMEHFNKVVDENGIEIVKHRFAICDDYSVELISSDIEG